MCSTSSNLATELILRSPTKRSSSPEHVCLDGMTILAGMLSALYRRTSWATLRNQNLFGISVSLKDAIVHFSKAGYAGVGITRSSLRRRNRATATTTVSSMRTLSTSSTRADTTRSFCSLKFSYFSRCFSLHDNPRYLLCRE